MRHDSLWKYKKTFEILLKIPLKFREIRKLLEENGFLLDHIKGSHYHYFHEDGRRTIVPYHGKNKDLDKGIVLAILKQAELR